MLAPGSDQLTLARAWQAVLGLLELEVSRPNFDTWLRATRLVDFDGARLLIEAPSSFVCDQLESSLAPVVHRAVSRLLGEGLAVAFQPAGLTAQVTDFVNAAPSVPSGTIAGRLNRRFTLDRYLTSQGNRIALTSASSLLEHEAGISPIVVWGSPGMGKTHLLHAVAHRATDAGWPVACLTAEEFTARFTRAIRERNLEPFQQSVRAVRLFVLDDLQYLSGKTGTLNELVHTIDAVTDAGGYVLIASEQHPAQVDLPERLASRLSAGLVTRVSPLLAPERRTFVQHLLRESNATLPAWAVERIASVDVPSIRVLQGAVNAAVAMEREGQLDLRRLDAELTRISVAAASPGLSDADLLLRIATHFEARLEDLTGRSRDPGLTIVRAISAAALQERGRSLREIGRLISRDASTVRDLAARGKALLEADPALRGLLSA